MWHGQFRKELDMSKDNDVIDISDLSGEDLRDRLRQIADLASCPCNTCGAICDDYDIIDRCDSYQLWYKSRSRLRELSKRARAAYGKHRKSKT